MLKFLFSKEYSRAEMAAIAFASIGYAKDGGHWLIGVAVVVMAVATFYQCWGCRRG